MRYLYGFDNKHASLFARVLPICASIIWHEPHSLAVWIDITTQLVFFYFAIDHYRTTGNEPDLFCIRRRHIRSNVKSSIDQTHDTLHLTGPIQLSLKLLDIGLINLF